MSGWASRRSPCLPAARRPTPRSSPGARRTAAPSRRAALTTTGRQPSPSRPATSSGSGSAAATSTPRTSSRAPSRSASTPWRTGDSSSSPVVNTTSFDTVPAGSNRLDPWSVVSGSVDHIGGYWVAAEGAQSLDLDGSCARRDHGSPSRRSRDTPIASPSSYSANPDRTSGTPEMVVKADGTTLGTFTHAYSATRPRHHLGSCRGELHGPRSATTDARVRVHERLRRVRHRRR